MRGRVSFLNRGLIVRRLLYFRLFKKCHSKEAEVKNLFIGIKPKPTMQLQGALIFMVNQSQFSFSFDLIEEENTLLDHLEPQTPMPVLRNNVSIIGIKRIGRNVDLISITFFQMDRRIREPLISGNLPIHLDHKTKVPRLEAAKKAFRLIFALDQLLNVFGAGQSNLTEPPLWDEGEFWSLIEKKNIETGHPQRLKRNFIKQSLQQKERLPERSLYFFKKRRASQINIDIYRFISR